MYTKADQIKQIAKWIVPLILLLHFGYFIFYAGNHQLSFTSPFSSFDWLIFVMMIVDLLLFLYIVIMFLNFSDKLSVFYLTFSLLLSILSLGYRYNAVESGLTFPMESITMNNTLLEVLLVIIVISVSIFQFLLVTAFFVLKPRQITRKVRTILIILSLINLSIFVLSFFQMTFSAFSASFYIGIEIMSNSASNYN